MSTTELSSDGFFLGAEERTFPPRTPLQDIPPVLPSNGLEPKEHILYLNGILTPLSQHTADMKELANTGASVIGIHSATKGLRRDLVGCTWDTFRKGTSLPAQTLVEVIRAELTAGRELHLVGHSRGALIISRALRELYRENERLEAFDKREFSSWLEPLKIETYGSGGAKFIDGPQYVHVFNEFDPIPTLFGTGKLAQTFLPQASFGTGAVVRRLSAVNKQIDIERIRTEFAGKELAGLIDETVHGPGQVYLRYRIPFEEARALNEMR